MALGLPLPHGCFLRFLPNSALSVRSLISRPDRRQPHHRSPAVVVITSTLDLQCRACPQRLLPTTRWAPNGLPPPRYKGLRDSSAPTPNVAWIVRCFPRRMVA